jgi:hypothetical protein
VSYDRKHWARTDTDYDEMTGHLIIKHTPKYVRIPTLFAAYQGRVLLSCNSLT